MAGGLFGWGPKDTMSKAERKAAKQRAVEGMRAQKQAAKQEEKRRDAERWRAWGSWDGKRSAPHASTGKNEATRHAKKKGSLGW